MYWATKISLMNVCVVWRGECLLEKMSTKWLRVFATVHGCHQMQDPLNDGRPPYPPKHWYYPYSERNKIGGGGGVIIWQRSLTPREKV